jgi:hypothetical protein
MHLPRVFAVVSLSLLLSPQLLTQAPTLPTDSVIGLHRRQRQRSKLLLPQTATPIRRVLPRVADNKPL